MLKHRLEPQLKICPSNKNVEPNNTMFTIFKVLEYTFFSELLKVARINVLKYEQLLNVSPDSSIPFSTEHLSYLTILLF